MADVVSREKTVKWYLRAPWAVALVVGGLLSSDCGRNAVAPAADASASVGGSDAAGGGPERTPAPDASDSFGGSDVADGGGDVADGGGDGTPAPDLAVGGACSGIAFGDSTTEVPACATSYAVVAMSITSASPRDDIEECRLTITDETGSAVLSDYDPPKKYATDPAGGLMLKYGCAGGLTRSLIGTLYFATAKLGGSLRFQVDGYDHAGKVIQTGSATADVVQPYPPATTVTLSMTRAN
jgi:hypothetical protein